MHRASNGRERYRWAALALMLLASLTIVLAASRSQAKVVARSAGAKPTVVLVNGAWANNASWTRVIERLQAQGYPVIAPPDPLQSLKGDAATIADLLKTIHGPVILVGHSYGGAVITNAAYGLHNVKALVYVDAFAPAKGESALGLDSSQPGSALGAGPAKVFNFVSFPGATKGDACSMSSLRCSSRRSRTGCRQRRVPRSPRRSPRRSAAR
jgi:pimeloyl-ACP methyl ester carboxylesterase